MGLPNPSTLKVGSWRTLVPGISKEGSRTKALRLRAEKAREQLSKGQRILKLILLVQLENMGKNKILEEVENDSEKEIGVSTARNGCTIQLKGPSKMRILQWVNMVADISQPEMTSTRAACPRLKV